MNKIKKNDHFYLIDGSGYIFRAYYALPPLTRKSDGLPTGAVSGFCNMLFKLLEDSKSNENKHKPTHFAVIFDSARKNFRNEIYSDYKGNRSDAPDDLIPQFEYIRKSVLAFNLPSIELLNYEADDLIATYSEQILKLGGKVTIVSSDKDLMQLYKKNIRIYDPMKNKFVNEEKINLTISEEDDKNRIDSLIKFRKNRDHKKVSHTLLILEEKAKLNENLIPYIIECAKNRCTLGEISDSLRKIFGEYS